MSVWTDELKAQVVADYQKAEPTPETSMDVVSELAEQHGFTPNSIRMILSKAGVYITKGAPSKKAAKEGGTAKAGAGTRVSKESAHAELTKAIEDAGKTADAEIIGKLTGKAAVYFTGLFK